jgi:hypothetical protein
MAIYIRKVVLLHNEPDSVNNSQNIQFILAVGTGILDIIDLCQRIQMPE